MGAVHAHLDSSAHLVEVSFRVAGLFTDRQLHDSANESHFRHDVEHVDEGLHDDVEPRGLG